MSVEINLYNRHILSLFMKVKSILVFNVIIKQHNRVIFRLT